MRSARSSCGLALQSLERPPRPLVRTVRPTRALRDIPLTSTAADLLLGIPTGAPPNESQGLALTRRALALAQAGTVSSRRSDAAPRPRFVLCNGQAAASVGAAQVAWADARVCRCGIERTKAVQKAFKEKRKRCGVDGRTQAESKRRKAAAAAAKDADVAEAA